MHSSRSWYRTPRAAGLAGCFLLAVAAASAGFVAGCGRGEGPRVLVVNSSGYRIDALWVHSEHDSVRVPPLAPGESIEVRPRVHGEDLLWMAGTFRGQPIESHGGDYVEGTGGYRFRATIDSAGNAEMKFMRLGLW